MEQKESRVIPATLILLLCVTAFLGVFTLLHEKRDFSETENRKLAAFPRFSVSALFDGSYADGLENWFNDAVGGRDMWLTLNLKFKTILGQRENGGVYLGKNRQLYLIPEEPDSESVRRNLNAIAAFTAAHGDINHWAAIIPNAATCQPGNLPKGAPVPDQRAFLQSVESGMPGVVFCNTADTLSAHSDEYIYFLTDHHWTGLGAKYAAEQVLSAMGLQPVTDYTVSAVTTSFEGTLASKSGRHTAKDTVEIHIPKTAVVYYVTYTDTMTKAASIYDASATEKKDAYTVFFGGNHPRVDITTTAGTGRTLLLFKDSYANSFVQFIWPLFDRIIMIDPRYYYDSAESIVAQESITDVLYLYNADTFGTDKNLYLVLGGS